MALSKKRSEFGALGFLLIAVIVVFIFETTTVRSYLVQNDYRFIPLHLCVAVVLLFNVYANIYLLLRTDTTTTGLVMPATLLPGWHYCVSCEANSPPRAFHCKSCDRCILRRDHHCVFSACCVGHKNYRYYMGLLFQVGFGSMYATIFHLSYVWSNMGGLNAFTFFAHCLPIPFFAFGLIDRWTLWCNFISMLCVIGAMFPAGLFAYHASLLAKNQTTHERQKSITQYNLKNWRLNMREALGIRWPWTVLLCPLINSRLPGDGIHFPAAIDHKYTR